MVKVIGQVQSTIVADHRHFQTASHANNWTGGFVIHCISQT